MESKILSKEEIIKCNILQKDYKILSKIITKLQKVIIENEYILIYSKNSCMKNLNELIKKMNEKYNKSIIEIFTNDMNILENDSIYMNISDSKSSHTDTSIKNTKSTEENSDGYESDKELKNIKNIKNKKKSIKNINKKKEESIINKNSDITINSVNLDLIDEIKKLMIDSLFLEKSEKFKELLPLTKYDPFIKTKEEIILLSKIVGFTSIKDIIYLNYNLSNYIFSSEINDKFRLLNKIFNPLDFEKLEVKENTIEEKIIINKIHDNKLITIFNSQCELKINIKNTFLKIKGFIKPDPLNIYMRTSQISNHFLYQKKNNFEDLINLIDSPKKSYDQLEITYDEYKKILNVDKDFADIYLKNMTIIEIIIYDNHNFIINLSQDYYKFLEINKIQFVKLIKNFTKDAQENIYNMFNIIKLLLLGNDENCSVASLLFNLIKDKKNSSHNETVANLIYNQLNYIAQVKLKKSSFNIKNELEKLKDITSSDIDLKKQVLLTKNMPTHIKKICLDKIEELKNSNSETYKIKMYVSILIQFPWLSDADDNFYKILSTDKVTSKNFLEETRKKLDNEIYGHKETKEKTIEMLGKIISVQGCNIHPIGLAGPPGVGKTKFAQVLAESLQIPFVQITLGGQNDGELLHGHGYTYSGAQPGLIIKKMVDAGSARCIMFFDELDKCAPKYGQINEISSILIHLTDPMTNASFQDRFFQEITFPLSKVIFVFSFNDTSKIDKILLDRMEVLNIESYNISEKINIANDYLLKDICKNVGFPYGSIKFTNEILTKIIADYTYEPGVRSLKRSIENILLKLNLDRIYQKGSFATGTCGENDNEYTKEKPLLITNEDITNYLGSSKITYKTIHAKPMIGMVNGMYATASCFGGIVPIQLTGNHSGCINKFTLKLTGNQKKIMKESIVYSFTTAINLLTEEGKTQFFLKYPGGIHIHTPEAATPKDGPSAGVAFTLAFLSVMLGLKIKNNIALTGEIDLHGNVTKIGGVKYKVQGAFKANVNIAYLPKENEEDYDKLKKEMPEIFDDEHCCKFVEHVLDVAKETLIDYDTKSHFIQN